MPEHNLRIVVLGSKKADKEFSQFSKQRSNDTRLAIDVVKDLERIKRKLQREMRKLKQAAAKR